MSSEEVKPWLVSSGEELAKDTQMINEWKARWSSSYPGHNADLASKIKWAKNVETVKPSRRRTRMADAEAPKNVGEILASIVLESCTEKVLVCAMCPRGMAKAAMMIADESKLLASKYRRSWPAYDGLATEGRGTLIKALAPIVRVVKRPFRPKPSAAAFGDWLAQEAPPGIELGQGTKPSSIRKELVVFASIECKKTDNVDQVIMNLLDSLGFEDASCEAGPDFAEAFFPLRDQVGEHLGVVEADGTTKIGFLVRPTKSIRAFGDDENEQKKQASSYEEFTNQLHTLAQEYEDSRYFVLVPKDGFLPANIDDEDDEDDDDDDDHDDDDDDDDDEEDDEEDDENEEMDDDDDDDDYENEEDLLAAMQIDMENDEIISAESHAVLWVPKYYNSEYARLFAHVSMGHGETSKMKATLQEGGSEAATLKLDLLLAEFNAMKSRFSKNETDLQARKLCLLLAITNALVDDDAWFSDLPNTDDLDDFISKKLASAWRELLKHNDSTLCIGLPSANNNDIPATPNTTVSVGDESAAVSFSDPRAPLNLFLENSKQLFDHYDIKFNYAPRKRRSTPDASTPAPHTASKKRKSTK